MKEILNKYSFNVQAYGQDVSYKVIFKHPYKFEVEAECTNPKYSFSTPCEIWMPSMYGTFEWKEFCEQLHSDAVMHLAWLHNLPNTCYVDFSQIIDRNSYLPLEVVYRGLKMNISFDLNSSNKIYDSDQNCYTCVNPILSTHESNTELNTLKQVVESNPYMQYEKDNIIGGKYFTVISELPLEEKLLIFTTDGKQIVNF